MQKSVYKPPMRWPLLTIDTTSTLAALHLRKIDRSMSCFVCGSGSFVFGRCHILFVILTLLFRSQVSVGVTGGQHSKGNWYFMHIYLCSVGGMKIILSVLVVHIYVHIWLFQIGSLASQSFDQILVPLGTFNPSIFQPQLFKISKFRLCQIKVNISIANTMLRIILQKNTE